MPHTQPQLTSLSHDTLSLLSPPQLQRLKPLPPKKNQQKKQQHQQRNKF